MHILLERAQNTFLWVAITFAVVSSLIVAGIRHEMDIDEVASIRFAQGLQHYYDENIFEPENLVRISVKEFKQLLSPSEDTLESYSTSVSYSLAILGETHPPFYYWTLRQWINVFGHSAFSIRSLSFIVSFVVIGFAFLFGLLLENKKLGLFSMALTVSTFHFIEYAGMARMHIFTLLISFLSIICFYKIIQSKRHLTFCFFNRKINFNIDYIFATLINVGLLNSFLFSIFSTSLYLSLLFYSRDTLKRNIMRIASGHVLFLLFIVYRGHEQLGNLPYSDFVKDQSFTLMEAITASFFNLTFFFRIHDFPYIQIFMIIILISIVRRYRYISFKLKRSERALVFVSFFSIALVVGIDILFQGNIHFWGSSRAVNFLMVSYLILILLFLKYIASHTLERTIIAFFLIASSGYAFDSVNRKFVEYTPQPFLEFFQVFNTLDLQAPEYFASDRTPHGLSRSVLYTAPLISSDISDSDKNILVYRYSRDNIQELDTVIQKKQAPMLILTNEFARKEKGVKIEDITNNIDRKFFVFRPTPNRFSKIDNYQFIYIFPL